VFVSYAQNLEDVILYRALRDIEAGFYVDVGAHDPTEFSVTRAFYDRGWSGVNIEPVAEYVDRLRKERPRDTNVQAAVGETDGEGTLFVVPDTGLSTLSEGYAKDAAERGFSHTQRVVPIRTLDSILRDADDPTVHFLKVDVEGSEGSVLRGFGFTKVRPWIVLVEATVPGTSDPAFESWDEELRSKAYEFVYFDGLNRFYIAVEHADLRSHFSVPPNVFDRYVTAAQLHMQSRCDALTAALASAVERGATESMRLKHLQAAVQEALDLLSTLLEAFPRTTLAPIAPSLPRHLQEQLLVVAQRLASGVTAIAPATVDADSLELEPKSIES
jgi:FkbM family methyltransferase